MSRILYGSWGIFIQSANKYLFSVLDPRSLDYQPQWPNLGVRRGWLRSGPSDLRREEAAKEE